MPDCVCQGRGWLGFDVPLGHPQFGEIEPCPNCKGTPQDYREPDRSLPYMEPPSNLYSDYPPPPRLADQGDIAVLSQEILLARRLLEELHYWGGATLSSDTKPQRDKGIKEAKHTKPPASGIHESLKQL